MNLPKNKHVHIFDFDETLCKTNAEVKIKDKEQSIDILMHPTDYPTWREERWVERFPDRFEMDFSEFRGYPTYGTPNKKSLTMLKRRFGQRIRNSILDEEKEFEQNN